MTRGLPKIDVEGLKSFIDEEKIENLIAKKENDKGKIREIIAKSLDKNRLELPEMAALLNADDPELVAEIKEGARELKRRIYGNRIVLFAPLYVGNDCINNCSYCGFRASNLELVRRTLSLKELEKEVRMLESRGHKRLILVYGEHPRYDADFIYETTRKVYETKEGKGEIRRVNINAAPFDVEGFKKIKSAGIGTFQIFQETYHQKTYAQVHPSGLKSNYLWRLFAFDRAMEAGIDDVSLGVLFGLELYRYEFTALMMHAEHLEAAFGIGPHAISVPRIKKADDIDPSAFDNGIDDDTFAKIVACIRIATPYTGMIISTRESQECRERLLKLGISQMSGGSKTSVGGYFNPMPDTEDSSQFDISDRRPLDEVIKWLMELGYLPSFCTACYRAGRTGERFMEVCKSQQIHNFCHPNAIITLKEYLEDYASAETKALGEKFIQHEMEILESGEKIKHAVEEDLVKIEHGERDFRF